MAYYSTRRGRWMGNSRRQSVPREDPHSPSSKGYVERHKVHESEFIGLPGLVRVDVGEPVNRLASEGRAKPSPVAAPSVREEAPTVTPKVKPTATGRAGPKAHRAITREP